MHMRIHRIHVCASRKGHLLRSPNGLAHARAGITSLGRRMDWPTHVPEKQQNPVYVLLSDLMLDSIGLHSVPARCPYQRHTCKHQYASTSPLTQPDEGSANPEEGRAPCLPHTLHVEDLAPRDQHSWSSRHLGRT